MSRLAKSIYFPQHQRVTEKDGDTMVAGGKKGKISGSSILAALSSDTHGKKEGGMGGICNHPEESKNQFQLCWNDFQLPNPLSTMTSLQDRPC